MCPDNPPGARFGADGGFVDAMEGIREIEKPAHIIVRHRKCGKGLVLLLELLLWLKIHVEPCDRADAKAQDSALDPALFRHSAIDPLPFHGRTRTTNNDEPLNNLWAEFNGFFSASTACVIFC